MAALQFAGEVITHPLKIGGIPKACMLHKVL